MKCTRFYINSAGFDCCVKDIPLQWDQDFKNIFNAQYYNSNNDNSKNRHNNNVIVYFYHIESLSLLPDFNI